MPEPLDSIALVYDDDAFREVTERPAPGALAAGRAKGLMGRQVAGKEFLDALLDHGRWSELVGLVGNPKGAASIQELWKAKWSARAAPVSGKRLRVLDWKKGWEAFLQASPPARLLHTPGPPQAQFAWARSAGVDPAGFAVSGVTHTLCTADVMGMLTDLVTAPFEPFDAIICTSRAAADVVRRVTGNFTDYLTDRYGPMMAPSLRPRVGVIPLGVDPSLYRPPTAHEKGERRHALGIGDDEVVVLYVGRMSFHAKAHPFPMYAGVAEAARRTGKQVRLVLSGWAPDQDVRTAFANGAAAFAPGVKTTFVDSLSPDMRYAIWHVADVYTSLSDNVQETFGLSVIQAMSCGLPVVATDWDGYRDLVADGETGFLVPTLCLQDATADATTKLLIGSIRYDEFLGECSQSTAVDGAAAADAYERLIADDSLRTRMAAAGRARVEKTFTWAGVVRDYEDLWAEQEAERARVSASLSGGAQKPRAPARYPATDFAFSAYPSVTLDDNSNVRAVAPPPPPDRLDRLLKMALTGYLYPLRCDNAEVLRRLLQAATPGCAVGVLVGLLGEAGYEPLRARATVAWMLKYDLLRADR